MSIVCEEHGPTGEAFLCEHLLREPNQLWGSREPTADNPCPDAWCLNCDQHFQGQGEWNETNEHKVPIKLVCQGCYKRLRLSNTDKS